jgi:Zn-dependent peptidase ImmA (M78 family)
MTDIEAEANAFAMELLMPTQFLLDDLKKMGDRSDR